MNKLYLQNPFLLVVLPLMWFLSTLLIIAVVVIMLLNTSMIGKSGFLYTVFGARPQVLGAYTSALETDSAEVRKVDGVFKKFKCPLYGTGEIFVREAHKNNIPYWLVASIAFQESSCGKNVPDKEGITETFNAWGWGVWGSNIKHFDNWEHGIGVVSKYMGERFYSQGITDTCAIMKIYTPPSNGSWCNGVNYFGDIIQNYSPK